jgi:hypothetical protein
MSFDRRTFLLSAFAGTSALRRKVNLFNFIRTNMSKSR